MNYSGTDYGPLGNYSCDDSNKPRGCGLGKGYLQVSYGAFPHGAVSYSYLQISAGAVLRGGYWYSGSNAGVFAADLDNGPLLSRIDVGFRCALSLLTESNSSTEESGFE